MTKMKEVRGRVTYNLRFTVWCKGCNGWFMSKDYRVSADFKEAVKKKGWKKIDDHWYCPKCARGLND